MYACRQINASMNKGSWSKSFKFSICSQSLMGMASWKNYVIAILVVLKDNHDFSIRVSDCSIRVCRSLLLEGKSWDLLVNPTEPICPLKSHA